MRKSLSALLVCLTLSIVLSGCARTIVMHPVTEKDIRVQDGWVCMTPEYIQEVMKARIEEKAK